MADGEQGNKTPTSQRRPYQNRGNYSNRGRGRHDPHVSKALYNFGVPDLRDWLNKKHEQEGETSRDSGPPPDPSYSYLKDPLRENPHSDDQSGKYKEYHERAAGSQPRGTSFRGFRGFRGRRGTFNRDERRSETEKPSYIQNPVNIKVELTTSTGERSYKVDEETKLADIKHVPDRYQQERRSFRGERDRGGHDSWRGRGRGRGRGESIRGRGESSRGRGESSRGRGESNRGRGEMSRGRGERGWGNRGGRRGYGHNRGQGRYNPDKSINPESSIQNISTTDVATEENWDDEGIDQNRIESEANINQEAYVEHSDDANPEEYYEETDELHGDYEEGGEYLETSEGYDESYSLSTDESHPTEESDSTAGIVLEENIIITSAADKQEENEKRSVRFKLDEDKADGVEKETKVVQEEAAAVEITKPESGEKSVEGGDVSKSKSEQKDADLEKAEVSKKEETPDNETSK